MQLIKAFLLTSLFTSSLFAVNYTCVNTNADVAGLQASANGGGTPVITGPTCKVDSGTVVITNSVSFTANGTVQLNGNGNKIMSYQSDNISFVGFIVNNGYFSTTTPTSLIRTAINITDNTFQNLTNGGTNGCYPNCGGPSVINFQGIGVVSSHIDRNKFINIWGQGYPTNPYTTTGATSSSTCYLPFNSPLPGWCVLDSWGAQAITINGMDLSTINNNTFSEIGNDAMHIDWNVFTGTTGPQRSTSGNQIKFNKFDHIRRIPMEIQSQPSYPSCAPAGSCNAGIVNTTGMQINGNLAHAYAYGYGDTWGSSLEFDGNRNGQDLNNTFISDDGGGTTTVGSQLASGFELALNNGLLQGNVLLTSSALHFGNRVSYGGNSNSSFTLTNQNNINCGSSGINGVSFEGSGFPTIVDRNNFLNTSSCPSGGTLFTSSLTTAYTSANARIFAPSTSQNFTFTVQSNLSIKFVKFFLDGSSTPSVTQEQQDFSTTFQTDRTWLYHATFTVPSSPGGHSLVAVATDVNDVTSTQTQTFSIMGSGPSFSASPSSLTFASFPIGTTSPTPLTIVVTNPGTSTLNISSQVPTGDFAIVSNTCGATITAGNNCTFGVTFTPTAAGTRTGAITFTDDAPDTPQAIPLSGVGTAVITGCSAPASPPNLIPDNPCGSTGLRSWTVSQGSSTTAFSTGANGPSGVIGFHASVTALTLPLTGNIEFFRNDIVLADFTSYTFTVDMKGSRVQAVNILGVQNGGSFHNYGLSCPKTIATSYGTTLTCNFTTDNSPSTLGPMRLTMQFDAANQSDTFDWSNITLLPASSAAVNISNITVTNTDHTGTNVKFTCSVACYPYIQYGLATGTYIYTSASWNEQFNSYTGHYDVAYQLALAPSTTFFILPTARPDPNDDTGICNIAACGAVEQTITTPALPGTHPIPPAAANVWNPGHPDFSAYTIVPMAPDPITGECKATSNVAAPGGGGWVGSVHIGDNPGTVMAEIGYGTAIEYPQGAICKVPEQLAFNHSGYVLPALALDPLAGGNIDSSAHRYIVHRTHQVGAADFPPVGYRTGPSWASKLAKFVVQTPGNPTDGSNPGLGVQNFVGQVFDCANTRCHHFWFEDLEMTHLADSTVYPGNVINPPGFTAYIRTQPAVGDITTSLTTPDYNVVDRVYAHGQPWPSRELQIMTPGGNHWAIMNSHLDSNMWWPGIYPTVDPTYSHGVITVSKQIFQYNAFDNTPIGMASGATATFTTPPAYTGIFMGWLDTNGLSIGWQTGSGVSLSCSGCVSVPLTAPTQGSPGVPPSYPASSMLYFIGHFDGAGNAVEDCSTLQFALPGFFTVPGVPQSCNGLPSAFRPLGLYVQGGNFAFLDNNFIVAIGQTQYNEVDNQRNDFYEHHNYWYFPRSKMKNSGQWDGYKYSYRNVLESKMGKRWDIQGNFFDGAAAYQNPGNAVYMTGVGNGPVDQLGGIQDWNVSNNTFKHVSSGIQCAAGGALQPPDLGARYIQWSNNLFWDLNRDLYNDGGGGFFSGAFSMNASCQDVGIFNNTVALTKGQGPALLLFGSPDAGTTGLGEGLSFRNNVLFTSLTTGSLENVFYSICGQQISSHPASPADTCVVPGTTTYTQMLNGSFLQAGSSVVPNWVMQNNIIVGGVNTGAAPTYTDLTQTQINTIAAAFPTGSPVNQFVAGATLALRQAAINWDATTYRSNLSSYNDGSQGANIDIINSTSGVVTGINISMSANGAVFSYTAPDTRACIVDTSTDSGVTWTRTTDSGGAQARNLLISGLFATFQYRLMCYMNQTATFEFQPNQITNGTFTVHNLIF